MTTEQKQQFREVTGPVLNWLYLNNPNSTIIITDNHAEIFESKLAVKSHPETIED